MPQFISKRDGSLQDWNEEKIEIAIRKAFKVTNVEDFIRKAKDVTKIVLTSINGNKIVDQEYVQNLVENSLMKLGYFETAKAYILYREKRREEREQKHTGENIFSLIDSYVNREDWRVNENANMGYSFQGMTLNISGAQQAKYWLNRLPEDVRTAYIEGFIHIHDLQMSLVGYCCGWSLYDLILEGFNKDDSCSSKPPKHFDTVLTQIVNFIGTLQNEWSGAQALNNVDTLCAPFIYYDKLKYKKDLEEAFGSEISNEKLDELFYKRIKQGMQRFLFNMNTSSRWGGQCPFSNITLDVVCPKHLSTQPVVIGGKLMDKTYGEFQNEMDMFNRAFVEVMLEGDADGRIFSFPIPTYNVTKDFKWDSELLKMTAKYGTPYFQNFVNSNISPEDIRSMCCRLSLDKKKVNEHVNKKTGGIFGAGDLTGSIGVVTINLARIAYEAKRSTDPIDNFFMLLKNYMDLAKVSLELKRKMLNKNMELGMYPWSKRYLKNGFDGHFSTIGIVGGHEACLNLFDFGIETNEGVEFINDVLEFMLKIADEFQEETDNLYNIEATPAEGTSYRLAKIDKKKCPGIIQSGETETYYTNSTQLPVYFTNDVFFALAHQDKLQPKYTGGTVFHTYIGEEASDLNSIKNFILKVFENTKLPYLSITPTFSICKKHGYLKGEKFTCPECGEKTEVYTRIVGYFRPVSRWNKGKQEEYSDRIVYELN